MVREPEYDLRAFAHGLRVIMKAEEIFRLSASEIVRIGQGGGYGKKT